MRNGKSLQGALAAGVVLAVLMLPAADALARAGGGTSHSGVSHSSSGTSFSHGSSGFSRTRHHNRDAAGDEDSREVLQQIMMIAAGVLVAFGIPVGFGHWRDARRKGRRQQSVQELTSRIAQADSAWNRAAMDARVRDVFYRVQQAWTERDVELARDCLSPRLAADYARQLEAMRREGRRNVLEHITFLDGEVVHILDRKGTRDDEFWALVSARMVDYDVPHYDTLVAKRDAGGPEGATAAASLAAAREGHQACRFEEIWKFVRAEHGWVLDKIEEDVAMTMVDAQFHSDDLVSQ